MLVLQEWNQQDVVPGLHNSTGSDELYFLPTWATASRRSETGDMKAEKQAIKSLLKRKGLPHKPGQATQGMSHESCSDHRNPWDKLQPTTYEIKLIRTTLRKKWYHLLHSCVGLKTHNRKKNFKKCSGHIQRQETKSAILALQKHYVAAICMQLISGVHCSTWQRLNQRTSSFVMNYRRGITGGSSQMISVNTSLT